MKRYIDIFLFAMISFLAYSCGNEKMDVPVYKDAGTLEVSFSYKDAAAKSIILTPAFQTVEIQAILNHEDVRWNVVSDQPWCIVDDETIHEGSGSFTVTVLSNDGYDDREPAVVSLCAGEYKANLRVTQIGNVFILDHVFGLGMKKAGSLEVMVKVEAGVEWTTRQPEWMTVDKEEVSTTDGETEYKLAVHWQENTSVSRLGTVELYRGDDEVASAKYALWQFGDGGEYDFDAPDGSIRLVSKPSPEIPLEIRTPSNHIEELMYPLEWVQMEKVENDDNTTSWLLYFGQNPSDCNSYRETSLTYTTLGSNEGKPLATIFQDYYPVGGLTSAKGFALFAETFNAGGDVSDWVKDGVVNVLSSVDMSGLETTWVSIGTEDRPFGLKFNGDNRTISGFTASAPLFGVCDGAEINDIVIDGTCSFTFVNDFASSPYIASLVGRLRNSTMSNCISAASVTVDARSVKDGVKIYAGGLVADVTNSTVTASRNDGSVRVTSKARAINTDIYVGGVAAYLDGIAEGCVNAGDVTDESVAKYHYVGGATGVVAEGAELDNCINTGVVRNISARSVDGTEVTNTVWLGGLVGMSHGDLKHLDNRGTASVTSDAKTLCIGGLAGRMQNGTLEKSYSTSGTVTYNKPEGSAKGKWVYVGGLVGAVSVELQMDCSGLPVSCNVNTVDIEQGGQHNVGGLFGFVTKPLTLTSPEWNGNIVYTVTDGNPNCQTCVGGIIGWMEVAGLKVTGAETSGAIEFNTSLSNNKYWYQGNISVGGVVGKATDGIEVSESTNNALVKWTPASQKSNNGRACVGGIAGRIDKGTAVIAGCRNNGMIANLHRNDNAWSKASSLNANRTGGILGAYGYVDDLSALDPSTSSVKITDCHTTSDLMCYRGLIGGIAGSLYNASVSGCSFTGTAPAESGGSSTCGMGGIAGAVENTTMANCIVKASFSGVSGGVAGGIVANLFTNSKVLDCKYFGIISSGSQGNAGAVAGASEAGCSVSRCSVGGSVLNETLTSANYSDYIVGNDAVTAVDCSYWDGE